MFAVLHPIGPGVQIVIDRAVVLVGRGADCDAVINFSSRISRMHCVFVQVDADYYIRDLGSMNGVRVNGERVEKAAKLVHGAEVAIGDVVFQFRTNVVAAPRVALRSNGRSERTPALVDHSMPILDAEIIDAEIIDEDITDAQIIEIDDVELIEDFGTVNVIDDVEIVDDFVEVVELIDEIEVLDDVEVLDKVEAIDDVEVIEDRQTVTHEARRPRRPPRLR